MIDYFYHNFEQEEDDDIPYNPKNLPLGWDGKPIPYWLYKLHGLNISYNCEICGNFTYKGPKAFQRHFSEWRHAHGENLSDMKRLVVYL
jgi:splicing factor 3A subunit 3